FGVGFVGCAAWYFWPVRADSVVLDEQSPLDHTILVECFWSQPPAVVPSYGFYLLQFVGNQGDGGISSTSQQPGTPLPITDNPSGYHACKFTNFSSSKIIKVEARFQLDYMESIKRDNGTTGSGN